MSLLCIWFNCLIGFVITGFAWHIMPDFMVNKKILRYMVDVFGCVALGLPLVALVFVVVMMIFGFKVK